jgi:hypothetical protein
MANSQRAREPFGRALLAICAVPFLLAFPLCPFSPFLSSATQKPVDSPNLPSPELEMKMLAGLDFPDRKQPTYRGCSTTSGKPRIASGAFK